MAGPTAGRGHRPAEAGYVAPRSRAATNELLARARAAVRRPGEWAGLLGATCRRSRDRARARPQALLQITALHLAFLAVARRHGWRWVLRTWLLAVTHLGLLEDRTSLGLANMLTLARANLPAVHHVLGHWVPTLALTSDFLDGRLARASGTESGFGQYADFLSDTAVWTWFSLREETSRPIRIAALSAWVAPVVVVLATSIVRGRMVDVPRRWWFRPAATVQVVLGVRMGHRWISSQGRQPRAGSLRARRWDRARPC